MGTTSRRWLYWTPRVLTVLYAAFLGLFALDVFDEGLGPWETVLALVIHLIPTWIVLGLLAVSWRHEWVAGTLLPLLAVLYVVLAWNKPFAGPATFAAIAGPLLVVGVLFLLNWRHRAELRPKA